jgi:hypothetical protein
VGPACPAGWAQVDHMSTTWGRCSRSTTWDRSPGHALDSQPTTCPPGTGSLDPGRSRPGGNLCPCPGACARPARTGCPGCGHVAQGEHSRAGGQHVRPGRPVLAHVREGRAGPMTTGRPTVSHPCATVPGMTSRLAFSGLCLLAMLAACALIVWGMSADYQCTGTGQTMSCHWSHSLIPGAQSPTTTHLENR